MLLLVSLSLLNIFSIKNTFESTTAGISPNGEIYICLTDDDACPTVEFGGQDSVNPRIVTPINLCPVGSFPCYGKDTKCGERLIKPTNLNDGKADKAAFPWQAYLRNSTHSFAGSGALLDAFHVITAAHKVEGNRNNPGEMIVYMGVWYPTNLENTQNSPVKEIAIHPSFNKGSLLNDIAILRLETPIVLGVQDNINTICLPGYGTSFINSTCMLSGWGQTSFTSSDAPTISQKQVTINIVDPETCRESFARPNLLGGYVDMYLDQVGEICAGGEKMRDACTQDGGSPLVCPDAKGKFSVAGLVIWGKNCGQSGVYGVYVNVSYYRTWIDTTIESLTTKYGQK